MAGALAARYTRKGLMLRSDTSRAVLLGGTAVLLGLGAPAAATLVLVGISSGIGSVFHPAKAALTPALTETPEQLTAMNVVGGAIENVGMFAGPALGGVILAASSPQVVFALTALCLVWSAAQVRGVRFEEVRGDTPIRPGVLVTEVRDALAAAVGPGPLRVMIGLLTAQTLVAGALGSLVVIIALDQLRRGEAWAGYLDGAFGVGGILGALSAASLVGRERLSGVFGLAMVVWGAPLAIIAVVIGPAAALGAMIVMGIGNTVGDIAYLTMLQRAVPEERIAQVFGGLESMLMGSVAVGGLAASLVVDAFGTKTALAASGLVLPLLTALVWVPLRRIDAAPAPDARALALLRGIPMFNVLNAPSIERLALAAQRVLLLRGEEVFRQGDAGEHYYVIEKGSVEVVIDGRPVRAQGAQSGFGEIALVRDIPRTATIVAVQDLALWALDRETFLEAMGANPAGADHAEQVAAARLSYARPALGR